MRYNFIHGDKVKLIGKDNPYAGESGMFVQYDKEGLERERLIVILDSDREMHYFFDDEVKLK